MFYDLYYTIVCTWRGFKVLARRFSTPQTRTPIFSNIIYTYSGQTSPCIICPFDTQRQARKQYINFNGLVYNPAGVRTYGYPLEAVTLPLSLRGDNSELDFDSIYKILFYLSRNIVLFYFKELIIFNQKYINPLFPSHNFKAK